jgi:hypothetical protein
VQISGSSTRCSNKVELTRDDSEYQHLCPGPNQTNIRTMQGHKVRAVSLGATNSVGSLVRCKNDAKCRNEGTVLLLEHRLQSPSFPSRIFVLFHCQGHFTNICQHPGLSSARIRTHSRKVKVCVCVCERERETVFRHTSQILNPSLTCRVLVVSPSSLESHTECMIGLWETTSTKSAYQCRTSALMSSEMNCTHGRFPSEECWSIAKGV